MTLLMDIIPFWVWGVMMLSNWVRLGQKKKKKKQMSDKAYNSLHNIGPFSSRRN
jgi:endonuclease I